MDLICPLPLPKFDFTVFTKLLGSSDFEFTKKNDIFVIWAYHWPILYLTIHLTLWVLFWWPQKKNGFIFQCESLWCIFYYCMSLTLEMKKKKINSPFVMVTIKFNTWTLEGDLQIISPYNITKKEMIFCWLKKTLIVKKILLISSAENVKRTV